MICPRDDHPSIYTGEYGAVQGLHHVCILVDDIAHARRVCDENGAEIVIEGALGDVKVIYVDPAPGTAQGGPGSLVEILQQSVDGPGLFAMIKQAAVDWDGSDPLRRLG